MYRVVALEIDETIYCERTLFRSKDLEDCFGFIDKRKVQNVPPAAKQMYVLDPVDTVLTRKARRTKKSVDLTARLA